MRGGWWRMDFSLRDCVERVQGAARNGPWHRATQAQFLGGLRNTFGLPIGVLPVCCWDMAMAVADALAQRYRWLPRGARIFLLRLPAHPAPSGMGAPCEKAQEVAR